MTNTDIELSVADNSIINANITTETTNSKLDNINNIYDKVLTCCEQDYIPVAQGNEIVEAKGPFKTTLQTHMTIPERIAKEIALETRISALESLIQVHTAQITALMASPI